MKIDVTQVLKNFNDIVVQDEKGKEITLRAAFTNGLLTTTPKSRKETGEQKYERYRLATLINTTDIPEITPEELQKFRTYIGDVYSPIVVGAAWNLIDSLGK